MNNPKLEYIYNIILSVFLGFLFVMILNQLKTRPRIINIIND